ncbi:aconitate hydratase [Microbacterium kribbense]|uniref:Aconitate hydratase n=1 Tax=Microbacterium kribbense TaxID=433645 RepID=A0ABP7GVK5_9MICO
MSNSFGAKDVLTVGDKQYEYYRLDAIPGSARLPYSLKVLLENLLRNEDGVAVTAEQIQALANWNARDVGHSEVQFNPARVLLQDFTGVPGVVDLVAMRDAMDALGGDPQQVNPLIPVELVIDHSVIAETFGGFGSFKINAEIEFERNKERYQLLRWAQHAFDNFAVVPPDTGICHQVNLEYLGRVVFGADGDGGGDGMPVAYPDTLVGTDSHTPMINGLGVLGWGVGGIEAEAAMLGQPISLLLPKVVGLKLEGELREGVTATDMVLTVAELLRHAGVVGKFVEVFGPGVANVPLANRATIGNMSPEYGSTCTIFPIDQETIDYLTFTGRSPERVALVEAYAKAQGMWHDPSHEPEFSQVVELDLSSIEPSIAGPKRPQDRIPLTLAARTVERLLNDPTASVQKLTELDDAIDDTFPASDPFFGDREMGDVKAPRSAYSGDPVEWESNAQKLVLNGQETQIDNGDVVIAAITSCTNTSNPSVMIGAALLARNAVNKGLKSKPWVKTSLAPGSRVVTDYFDRAGLTPYLDQLGFNLVGYGCTTCIGNSGPLPEEVATAVDAGDLTVAAVLSGNRNFEGRIHPQTRMNFLASPPLVVAYALAGSMHVDLNHDPLGTGSDGNPVYLHDLWPSSAEIKQVVDSCIEARMYTEGYADVYAGDDNWNSLPIPEGQKFTWQDDSTYVRQPPYFDGMGREPGALADITGARVLAKLGDSVTTDHISPAGSIKFDSPAGKYLAGHGVTHHDFNSYGSRRGNHEVMIRGTFANIRLRNQLVEGTEGGFTRVLPGGTETVSIYDAAQEYAQSGTPLVVLAGKEYGSGSSRDWAAKGTILLGAKAVLAESYERIHRSNLIGMGVLPLQYVAGDTAQSLELDGTETYSIIGLSGQDEVPEQVTVRVQPDGGQAREFTATVRIDTPTEREYYRHGGILQYVLRQRLNASA